MNIIKSLKSTGEDFKQIWKRLRTRDFSGNTGLAVKNSFFQLSSRLVAKIGSLIFTIILARLLLPELFGLYSLALSTIVLFSAFSNPGIAEATIRFVSRQLGRNNKKKAKAYAVYLGKLKFLLVFISIIILLFSAKFISETIYSKPIFLALIAGSLYIIFFRITSFMQTILQASNLFKQIMYKEIFMQSLKIILVSSAVLFALKYNFTSELTIGIIILALSLTFILTALLISFLVKRKTFFFNTPTSKLVKNEKRKTNKFVIALSATFVSGMFFANIDILILGHFVFSEFIGYYKAASSLILGFFPLISFSIPLLPIFSKLGKKQVDEALKRSRNITFLLAIPLMVAALLLSSFIVPLIYGQAYSNSIGIFKLYSLLLIIVPLIGLYQIYFISIGKPGVIAKLLIISTLINIVLNYVLISTLVNSSHLAAVFGATAATIFSKAFLLGGLILAKNKETKLNKKTKTEHKKSNKKD